MSPQPSATDPVTTTSGRIMIFSMSSGYKKEEKAIRSIVLKNCTPTNPNDKLQLVVYYKARASSSVLTGGGAKPPQ